MISFITTVQTGYVEEEDSARWHLLTALKRRCSFPCFLLRQYVLLFQNHTTQ